MSVKLAKLTAAENEIQPPERTFKWQTCNLENGISTIESKCEIGVNKKINTLDCGPCQKLLGSHEQDRLTDDTDRQQK